MSLRLLSIAKRNHENIQKTEPVTEKPRSKQTLLYQFVLLLIAAFSSYSASAHSFEGLIENRQGKPIGNVYVLNLNNGSHTHSNAFGRFTLENVKQGDTIQFSHSAYQRRKIVVVNVLEELKVVMQSRVISLPDAIISPKINAMELIADFDIQNNPVGSSQEVLRQVPGLIIGQHAGGGKAEQIFMRGFDVDHGTDVAIDVDGMPVNMVSHAHGQGYADLHFLIPETIEKVSYGKGAYYADKGNFNTAGYISFRTKSRLDQSLVRMETGMFNYTRLLGMFNLLNIENQSAYVATEIIGNDGPFESPQVFNRVNVMGTYSIIVPDKSKLRLTTSHFTSKWDASGQIPTRAVESGLIGRFGAIDDTEGGLTSRSKVNLQFDQYINKNTLIKSQFYYVKYDFELYSNFTFFLTDSANGDQIRQKEDRSIFGFRSELSKKFKSKKHEGSYQIGVESRMDDNRNVELSRSQRRFNTLENLKLGQILETNHSAFAKLRYQKNKWQFNPGIRADYFVFQYNDDLAPQYQTLTANNVFVSPKLNILYTPSKKIQHFLKMGRGFHSNDTRVAVTDSKLTTIPPAYGADLGFIWKPKSNIVINAALWYLYMEQEFVYVGDAGIVEPNGETTRQGIDLSVRYQPRSWFTINWDANYAHARFNDLPEGENYIPLAPALSMVGSVNLGNRTGLNGGIDFRFVDDRPANEDNSIVAIGYTVIDANVAYNWNSFRFAIQVQNLLDTEWNETQFATESLLRGELNPVEEIHYTPGIPFMLKAFIGYSF